MRIQHPRGNAGDIVLLMRAAAQVEKALSFQLYRAYSSWSTITTMDCSCTMTWLTQTAIGVLPSRHLKGRDYPQHLHKHAAPFPTFQNTPLRKLRRSVCRSERKEPPGAMLRYDGRLTTPSACPHIVRLSWLS